MFFLALALAGIQPFHRKFVPVDLQTVLKKAKFHVQPYNSLPGGYKLQYCELANMPAGLYRQPAQQGALFAFKNAAGDAAYLVEAPSLRGVLAAYYYGYVHVPPQSGHSLNWDSDPNSPEKGSSYCKEMVNGLGVILVVMHDTFGGTMKIRHSLGLE